MIKDKRQLTTLATLLILEVLYVVAEFGFNAAILNAASGALGMDIDLDYLTIKGKHLSGIGLGLLIFGFVVARTTKPQLNFAQMVLAAALVFPPAIYGMTAFQTWLINEPLVNNASDEELLAAHYLQYAAPAIRDGVVQVDGVPIAPTDIPRPETKAFLSLIGPTLLHNDKAIEAIAKTTQDLIKIRAQKDALDSVDRLYRAYLEHLGPESFDTLYKAYEDASWQHTIANEKEIREVNRWNRKYDRLNYRLKTQWARYQQYHKYDGNVWGDYSDVIKEPGLSETEVYAHAKTLKVALGVTDPDLVSQIRPEHFTYERGIGGSWLMLAKPFFRIVVEHETDKAFREEVFKATEAQTGLVYHDKTLQPHLSRTDLARTTFLQALVDHLMHEGSHDTPLPTSERYMLRHNMNKTEFTNEFLIPAAWEKADHLFSDIPKSADTLDRSNPLHTQPLKTLYVPAIALTFSLIFSLLTLAKIIGRVWMILALRIAISQGNAKVVRMVVTFTGFIVIVSLPAITGTSRLAQTEVIEAAAGEESGYGVPARLLRWTLDVEPLLFPVGNAIAKHMTASWLDLAIYHDAKAGDKDPNQSESQVQSVKLLTPLSVIDLQRALRAKGYDPGPADGILGPGTTEAVRAFQRDNGLPQTGVQNQKTVGKLRTQP